MITRMTAFSRTPALLSLLASALLLGAPQAKAAKELIKCVHHGEDSTATLKVSETSLGMYEVRVFQCQDGCRNPREFYHRRGPVHRGFSGARPAMTFKKDDVHVAHIFGAQLYSDGRVMIEFPDNSCEVTPPDDHGLIVGFAELEPGPCGTPVDDHMKSVRAKAVENAREQCPSRMVSALQDVQVESFCLFQGKGNLYLRAAGLFQCAPR